MVIVVVMNSINVAQNSGADEKRWYVFGVVPKCWCNNALLVQFCS